MNLQNFTIKSQEAVEQAVQLAIQNGQQSIETTHLLQSLMQNDEQVIGYLLKKLNVRVPQVSSVLQATIHSLPKVSGAQPYLSNDANQVLIKAQSYLKEF
ncbi:MAG: Clp protease N-terminal domain-containing protein, partial [Bacteroidota bacterium]